MDNKGDAISPLDIRIDTFRTARTLKGNGVSMTIIHEPTGILVRGEGLSSYRLRKKLMEELEGKVVAK